MIPKSSKKLSVEPSVKERKPKRVKEPAVILPEPELEESKDKESEPLPKWSIKIEGLQEMEASLINFSVFTPGEASSGQLWVKFLTKPKVNSTLIKWLSNPIDRKLFIEINDPEDVLIEKREMLASPIAISFDELDVDMTLPFCTTVKMSVKMITIV